MSWPTFTFWNALGGVCWALSVGLAGYFAGHAAETAFSTAGLAGAGGVVLLALLYGVLRLRRRRAEQLVDAELEPES
jgi:membrane protein DedA with SNARE-associated domain